MLYQLVSLEVLIRSGALDSVTWVEALCLDGVLRGPIATLVREDGAELLLQSLFLGAGPAWSTLAAAEWPIFEYFSSLASAFKELLLRRGMPTEVSSGEGLERSALWLRTLQNSGGADCVVLPCVVYTF